MAAKHKRGSTEGLLLNDNSLSNNGLWILSFKQKINRVNTDIFAS